MLKKVYTYNLTTLFLVTALSINSIPVYSIPSYLAPPGFVHVIDLEMRAAGSNLNIADIGTAGTHNKNYADHIHQRIENDMLGERFVRIIYENDTLTIDVRNSGRHASSITMELKEQIEKLNKDKKLVEYLGEHIDSLQDFALYLLETHPTLKYSKHPHLLSMVGKQFSVAYSDSSEGREQATYITRAAFTELKIPLLRDILRIQAEVSIARHKAWHNAEKLPLGTFTTETGKILNRLRRVATLKEEIRSFHMYEVDIQKKYSIDAEICESLIRYWRELSEVFPSLNPIKANIRLAEEFKEALAEPDFDHALYIWGQISYELTYLKNKPNDPNIHDAYKELLNNFIKHNKTRLLLGLTTGINEILNSYVKEHGIYNNQGQQSGTAVGTVRIIADVDKVNETFDQAIRDGEWDIIWVVPYLPDVRVEIPGVGLICDTAISRHATDSAKEQKPLIPAVAIIPHATELLKEFNGKIGMLRVLEDRQVRFREAFSKNGFILEDTDLQENKKVKVKVPKAVMGKRLFADLSNIDIHAVSLTGPKAANAGYLMNNNISVPPGFSCLFNFWQKFAEHNSHVMEEINIYREMIIIEDRKVHNDPKELKEILSEIRSTMLKGEFPEEIKIPLLQKITSLRSQYGKISFKIRSTFNFEDLTENRTPGNYDSYTIHFDVDTSHTDEQILTAIKKVFASMWNEAAFSNRLKEGIEDAIVVPGIVIQVYINSKIAGVMYTADDVSNSRNKISIMWGLDDSVVSQHGWPGTVIFDKLTDQINELHDTSSLAASMSSTRRESTVLSHEKIRELARMGEYIEELYDYRPQDIEWCIDDNDKIWIVQTRPMKTEKLPAEKPADDEKLDLLSIISEEKIFELMEARKNMDTDTLIQHLHLDKELDELSKQKDLHAERMIAAKHLASIIDNAKTLSKIKIEDINRIVDYLEEQIPTILADYTNIPEILAFLSKTGEASDNKDIKSKISAMFLTLGKIVTTPAPHTVNFEIAKALVLYKKYDLAISKFRNTDYLAQWPDVVDRTLRILSTIHTENSMAKLKEIYEYESMPNATKEFALRIIDRLEKSLVNNYPKPPPPSRTIDHDIQKGM